MNFAKRMFMVVGVVALAVLIVAVLAPNTAHGLVAALVQVTNTTANPVPTVAADNPARNAVVLTIGTSSLMGSDNNYSIFPPFESGGVAYQVPAGHRLVVESISGQFTTPTGEMPRQFSVFWISSTGESGHFYAEPVHMGTFDTFDTYVFSTQFTTYVEPGAGLTAVCQSYPPGGACGMTLSGHLESIQ